MSISFCSISAQKRKNKLVFKRAKVELIQTEFTFTEGPAVAADRSIYFTDQPNNKIHIWNENNGASLYKKGTRRSNGMYFNSKQQLVTCADEKKSTWVF